MRTPVDSASPLADGASTTRRRALQMGVAALAAGVGLTDAGCARAQPGRAAREGDARGDDALDEALRRLHASEPRSKQGLSTHAPMVAEALCALGHGDMALAWIEGYQAPVIEIPQPSRPIERGRWRAALGPRPGVGSWEAALARWGDWKVLFDAELAEAGWEEVLDTWVARLAPGFCAAAMHGIIRTAHAARALSRRRSPERLGELSRGLAYWAASYQELPARGVEGRARVATYEEALERLPLHTEERGGVPSGNIVSGLRAVATLERFGGARDLVQEPADVSAALSRLTSTFARAYLRHGARAGGIAAVALAHAVTGPCALRRLLPHVKAETARATLPYAWQAAAGIYCAYARREDPAPVIAPELTPEGIRARALENGSDHAIKLTEALLAEHAPAADPVYLAAAEDAARRL